MLNYRESSSYKILLIAIGASLIWHIFWLSMFKVVSAKAPEAPVRFSKVSFLGPILSRVNMEVRATPTARSFLEKRFMNIFLTYFEIGIDNKIASKYNEAYELSPEAEERLKIITDNFINGEKTEPDRDII